MVWIVKRNLLRNAEVDIGYILLLGAISILLIYLIDFVYRKIKKPK